MGLNIKKRLGPVISRHRKLFAGICALVIVGLVVVIVWQSFNSTNYGQVKLPAVTANTKPIQPEYTSLENEYFKFDYPGSYSSVPIETSGNTVLSYKLVKSAKDPSQPDQAKVSAELKLAGDAGVVGDKDYQMYAKQTKTYSMSNQYYHGEAIDLAIKKTGGTEQAAIWLHGKYILVIKMTKPVNNASLDRELKDILTSLQWQN